MNEEIVRLYQEGLTMAAVAAQLGTSYRNVQRVLVAKGVPRRTRRDWKTGPPQKVLDEALLRSMRADGHSSAEIAAVFGVSPECVRERMVALGIPRLASKARPDHNFFWNGGRTVDADGYVLIKVFDHPHANRAGYVREHRLVMERVLGRYLDPQEVVDHIDGKTANNDPANLRVFASNGAHLAETLKGRTPNWTPEGAARMPPHLRRAAEQRSASRQASADGGGPLPGPSDRPPA